LLFDLIGRVRDHFPMKKLKEVEIERQILEGLNIIPEIFAWKTMDQKAFRDGVYWKGSKYQIRGVSDIIAIKNSKVYFLEVKTPHGRQSNYQAAFQNRIEKHGGTYAIVRSLDDALKIVAPEIDIMR